ncbi:MAG: GNAT family N-acetyltransferase, partial [Pseudomonadota bacterium]
AHRARLLRDVRDAGPKGGRSWIVEWRERPGVLGWCGVFPLEQTGEIEIGYRYVSSAWGQGVATEAAWPVLTFGFAVMDLQRIVAVTHPANHASQRVLAKIGLRRCGNGFHYGHDLPFFAIDRPVTRPSHWPSTNTLPW